MYDFIKTLGLVAQILFLLYFSILQLSSAYSGLIAVQYLRRMLRQGGKQTLEYQLKHNFVIPISILVPAYNEEATIVTSLRSFLSLHYPDFEIVAINDGSSDKTIDIIKEEFDLVPTTHYGRSFTKTAKVIEVYRSLRYPNLTVIDKENGGKADALNVGLAYARKSIFTAVDADSLLDADALLRMTRRFKEEDDMIAIGGTIRVLNNAKLENGKVVELKNPKKWIERFQVIEYIRAFYIGRASLSHFNMQLIISGAFGIFKRNPVIEVGGYRSDTVGEDMELVVRLHRWAYETNTPYSIRYSMDSVCWTQVPNDWKTLLKQRNRWQRGLIETLINHHKMFLNPKYGRIGLIAMPYFWFFEALTPIIEITGYFLTVFFWLTGTLNKEFALLFIALAIFGGSLSSLTAFTIEVFMPNRYADLRSRLVLMFTSLLENFGYRQLISFERLKGSFQVWQKKGKWGEMKREAIDNSN